MEFEGARSHQDPDSESAGARLVEVVPVGAEGTFCVDLALGAIRVEAHDEPVVAVEATATGPAAEEVSFQLEREGPDVVLSGEVGRLLGRTRSGLWLRLRAHLPQVRVRARVPRGFDVDVSTAAGPIRLRDLGARVAAESAAGPIEIQGARGPVLARAGAGPVRVRDIAQGLRAHTAAGPIGVRDVGGPVEVRTLGGPIRIRGASGRVEARSGAGSITVCFPEAPEGLVATSAGSIDVRVPAGAGAEIEARTSIGRVRVDRSLDFAGTLGASAVRGRLGSGGPRLELRSAIGGISIRPSTAATRRRAAEESG